MTKINPNRLKPFGFQASLLYVSDGPITSLPIAFAAAAVVAALLVVSLIPPEPRRNKAPKIMKVTPSRNEASAGSISGYIEKNHKSKR